MFHRNDNGLVSSFIILISRSSRRFNGDSLKQQRCKKTCPKVGDSLGVGIRKASSTSRGERNDKHSNDSLREPTRLRSHWNFNSVHGHVSLVRCANSCSRSYRLHCT